MNPEKNKHIINEVIKIIDVEKDYCLSEKSVYNIGVFGLF